MNEGACVSLRRGSSTSPKAWKSPGDRPRLDLATDPLYFSWGFAAARRGVKGGAGEEPPAPNEREDADSDRGKTCMGMSRLSLLGRGKKLTWNCQNLLQETDNPDLLPNGATCMSGTGPFQRHAPTDTTLAPSGPNTTPQASLQLSNPKDEMKEAKWGSVCSACVKHPPQGL